MTIIQVAPLEGTNYHPFQSQSHREACWEAGFVAVPEELLERIYACRGYCELRLKDGVLTDIIPLEIPKQPPQKVLPEEDRDTMLVDLSYRVTLLELGVN